VRAAIHSRQRNGAADCPIPAVGGPWLKTLPPVYLAECRGGNSADLFHLDHCAGRASGRRRTTASYTASGPGTSQTFLTCPRLTSQKFRMAQNGIEPRLLESHGLGSRARRIVSQTPASYRHSSGFARLNSACEKTVYVKMRGGWSATAAVCYLPRDAQCHEDTGLGDWLGVGDGVVTFQI